MSGSEELCSLRWDDAHAAVEVIDQTLLPHTLSWCRLEALDAFCRAISDMQVRGAPLIGATAAYGLALALRDDPSDANLSTAVTALAATRPTAVNLAWALERMVKTVSPWAESQRAAAAEASLPHSPLGGRDARTPKAGGRAQVITEMASAAQA